MAYININDRIAYDKQYYREHKNKRSDQKRAHYLKHRTTILDKLRDKYVPSSRILKTQQDKRARDTRWRIANRDKYNAYMREWTRKNRDRLNPLRMARYNDDSKLRDRFYRLTVAAHSRGRIVTISLEEFSALVMQPCTYCGEANKRRSIDRTDNKIGYTKENSVPCCKICNYMKSVLSVEDFLLHVKKIANYK